MHVPQARRARICEIVFTRQRASVAELAEALGVSGETIRRDIAALHARGFVQKAHGGAVSPNSSAFGAYERRQISQAAEKRRIAAAAAALLAPGDSLMINGGSTTSAFAAAAARGGAFTIVTNSLSVARSFWQVGAGDAVHVIGGEMRNDTDEAVGGAAVEQIARFRVRRAILTVDAIDADGGVSGYRIDAVAVARAMIARAEEVIVLADHTKFEARGLSEICRLSEVGRLVTDRAPPPVVRETLAKHGAELIVAESHSSQNEGPP